MRIKRLDISGFKSFCDHTRILFDSSLTAVVGPNGCGKSNIVDAIRWGLGEQSPKNLRGKGMDDVIFNGSSTRGPQSMAEVVVTFDNNDGLSHPNYVEFPEIAVTRRLHRDGSSEYLINNTPCRLRDITELFLGTGGGARAYSIIEQGRIGLIVSSRSEDRRAMIEEAAGITRFKKARILASRKMDQTRQNLLRITDVITEMERSLSSLKRQAKKAERYKRYAGEQRDLELYSAGHRYLELRATAMVARAALGDAHVDANRAREDLETMEARVEKTRLEEAEVRNVLEERKARAYELDNSVGMIESEIKHLGETMGRVARDGEALTEQESEAAQRMEALEEERRVLVERLGALEQDAMVTRARREEAEKRARESRESLVQLGKEFDAKRDHLSRARARVAAATSARDNLDRRLAEGRERLGAARDQRRAVETTVVDLSARMSSMERVSSVARSDLETARGTARDEDLAYEVLKDKIDDCDTERQKVRDDLQGKSSRLGSLEEMRSGLERHDRAVREAVQALEESHGASFEGLLVDFIECPGDYEVALAAALADRLQGLVTSDHEAGMSLLEWLKDRDLGRVTALPMSGTLPRERGRAEVDDEAVVGRLMDHLEVDGRVAGLVDNLLGGVYLVGDVEDARRLWEKYDGAATFVTTGGQLIDAGGTMRGGRPTSPGSDLLGQKRQIRELEHEVRFLQARHEELEERFTALKEELLRRKEAAEKAKQEAQSQEFILAEANKDRERAREDLQGARARLEEMDSEIEHQLRRVREMVSDLDVATAEMAGSEAAVESLEARVKEHADEIEARREETDRLAAAAADARVKEAQFEQQHRSALERSSQIEEATLEIESRKDRFARRKAEGARDMGKAAGMLVRQRELLGEALDLSEVAREEVGEAAKSLDSASADLVSVEGELKKLRAVSEEFGARLSDLRMEVQQAELDVAHLLDGVSEKHDIELLKVLGDYHMRPSPGEEVALRIEELKRLIDRMGPINPAAIDEYEETRERYETKVEQKADVEQALEDLEGAISRMDKDSRRLFKETFEIVNEKFQKIFPRLFMGGQAKLVLTDPSDMLTTGVDIVAQPPGKKLQNIELMSGGEKALTAVSLLFAIFLYRPSPFCLLDEVDAPLDEANVKRFVEMVRELTDRSQFIVITHSKVTMEGSDALYGVTMQEPGVSKMVSVRLIHSVESAAVNA